MLKRTILSAYPVKVSRSFAMLHFMFFNPQDVRFADVERARHEACVGAQHLR